uniref:non-specific serine/threonine protein kinase n=1 Tax=Fundulus heteroclitus TaxID=8078 RepID=A0A3Q2PZ26_FUNHE
MVTSALVSGKQQGNKSISSESSSNLTESSCRKRKANIVTELDKKLWKENRNNVNFNAGEPQKLSVEFVREWAKRKYTCVRGVREKTPRSSKTKKVLARKIVICSGSKSNEVLVQNRSRNAIAEPSKKREVVSGREQGTSSRTRNSSSSSSSESKEELVQNRSRKRKATANAEPSKKGQRVSEPEHGTNRSFSDLRTSKYEFERKYKQLGLIGRGGFGSVYAGQRLADSLPVAIKYANSRRVQRELKAGCVPLEVVLMQRSGGGPESVGKFAAVTLLDWYCVDQKLVLVMERPQTSLDLAAYVHLRGGRLQEDEARVLMNQLVDASMEMHSKGVFHRDLKLQNALVEIGSPVPRLRIIDFGCGSFEQKNFSCFFCDYACVPGTLPYAPPEWFRYEKYKPVPTTVWQLGVMLYCMLHKL